jgi:hypothetical protein
MAKAKPKVYDADALAAEREAAGLKLNGTIYKRRRRNNRLRRQTRQLSRRQTELQEEQDELTRERDVEKLEARRDALEAERDSDDSPPSDERRAAISAQLVEIRDELREIREGRDEDRIAELEDEFEDTLFELLAILLGPNENGDELSAEQLGDLLDVDDAIGLSAALMGVADDDDSKPGDGPDPT